MPKKTLWVEVVKNASGVWVYIDAPEFYLETSEYTSRKGAMAALKRVVDLDEYELAFQRHKPSPKS